MKTASNQVVIFNTVTNKAQLVNVTRETKTQIIAAGSKFSKKTNYLVGNNFSALQIVSPNHSILETAQWV